MGMNGMIQSDPTLDPNYRIDASSPAAGQGIPIPMLPASAVVVDYDGKLYGTPPAIGAFSSP